VSSFRFEGVIPASKSHFNRALTCASYGDNVQILGASLCDDVVKMKEAFQSFGKKDLYDCGSAGTVLRFLALRMSRLPGVHILKGTERLLSRPQDDMQIILEQLGVKMDAQRDRLIISSVAGWGPKGATIKVNREKSSQFASGVLLNAWDLDFPLRIEWDSPGVSEGYWKMSVQVVKEFGMDLIETPNGVEIAPHSRVKIKKYQVESDISSTFAIAAHAALNGSACFLQFPYQSLQPDKVFVDILEKMGAGIERSPHQLRVFQKVTGSAQLNGINWNLNECPDLFPVLATLCAFAKGPSRLDGAPHLIFKESNRIQKTAELLQRIGVSTKILADGMEVHPPVKLIIPRDEFEYDTDHDHRLAFAASMLASQNCPIKISHPEVVNKSFPEFWDILSNGKRP